MLNLCAECNVCSDFMPEQKTPRTSKVDFGCDPVVLVIDDASNYADYPQAIDVARILVGDVDFTYTTTIRCNHYPTDLKATERSTATARCAVWTHGLLENRMVILSTQRGMNQMKIETFRVPGDMFRNSKLGLLLCISPLLEMNETAIKHYKVKTQRLLREAKLV